MINRIVALLLAVALTVCSAPCSWADEAAPVTAAMPADPTKPEVTGGDIAAAAITNVVWVPARVGMCIAGGVAWALTMTLSGCTAYKTARDMARSGCTGKWILKSEDFAEPNNDI